MAGKVGVAEMSEYEKLRNKNIQDNKRILAELGLANFLQSSKVTLQKNELPAKKTVKSKSPKQKPTQKRKLEIEKEELGSIRKRRRRSARIQGKEAEAVELEDEVSDDEDEVKPSPKIYRPKTYGVIEGVEIGASWMMRIDCSKDGIHRPTVAGIHGGPEGAYSIALSGGYDDNIDLGEGFTYTGEGGRDLKGTKTNPKNLRTAPQSKDQTLTRGNLALSKNVETRLPVRVIRGYKLTSVFAPEEGYRYDGLYTVEKCWFTTGVSGFGVWKFALKRCPNQAPPPWTVTEFNSGEDSTDDENSRGGHDADQVEKKTELQTKSKNVEVLNPQENTSKSTSLLDTNSSEHTEASSGSSEDDETDSTGNINGHSRDNGTDKGDQIDQCGSEEELEDKEKVENGTLEENTSANKENVKNDMNNLKTVHKNIPNCSTDSILSKNDSKTMQGDSVEEGYPKAAIDNLATEDDPER